jgi:PAS domain S-box-containing protein/diguanylate cyclase (GGDEF)-like protein
MSGILQPEVLRAVIESLRVGLCLIDCEQRILLWNDGAERITGYFRQELIGKNCQQLSGQCGQTQLPFAAGGDVLKACLQEGSAREASIFIQHKLGHRIPVHVWAVPIRDGQGRIMGAAETFEECKQTITDPTLRAENLATHHCLDLSCEVPNHVFTRSYLREQLAIFAEHGLPFGVLAVSIREFPHLNRAYGRSAAEAALRTLVGTIRHYIGSGDFVGRWSDNEFLAVLSGCTHTQLEEVANSVNRILNNSEIIWWGDRLPISVSVQRGVVEVGDTIESLLHRVEKGFASAESASTHDSLPEGDHSRS